MTNIKNSNIAYLFYALGTIDYVSANYFNNDLTGMPFSPIIFGGIGSIFMFVHNSKIKESNNNVYELFKFSLYAVLISDDRIDESELEYSSSILNTLENELLLPTNPTKLEQEILNYDLNNIYEKIQNLEPSIPYKTKLNILSSCAILCVMDGQIDDVEQESIYKISNILNISENDMKNIFNASIASYIDFKNSDREKLKINDSEVKKVVEEKKAENKSNKNQIYVGIGVFAALTIFGIYSSFQVTIEESCDNFINNYDNKIVDLSNKSIETSQIMNDTVNEFYRLSKTDNYKKAPYEEQLEIHKNLFSNFSVNLAYLEENLESINSLNFAYSSEHEDLEQAVYLFELYKFKTVDIKTNDINYYYTFLQKVALYEKYFYDWDQSNSETDRKKISDIFNEENKELTNILNEIDSTTTSLTDEKIILRNNYVAYTENICVEYSWGE
jgi:uncharacterized tellurite resistance protein B-like protein